MKNNKLPDQGLFRRKPRNIGSGLRAGKRQRKPSSRPLADRGVHDVQRDTEKGVAELRHSMGREATRESRSKTNRNVVLAEKNRGAEAWEEPRTDRGELAARENFLKRNFNRRDHVCGKTGERI